MIKLLLCFFLFSTLISCQKVESDTERLSYAYGYKAGKSFKNEQIEINAKAYLLGLKAGLADESKKEKQFLNESEMIAAENKLQEKKSESLADQINKNKEAGEKFLQENLKNPNIKTTDSGLQYEILKLGQGPLPKLSNRVKVFTKGTLLSGEVFESYSETEPTAFSLSDPLPGWREGIQLMPVGSKFKFYLPSTLAFGTTMRGKILPFSTVVYEIELVEILDPPKNEKAKTLKKK